MDYIADLDTPILQLSPQDSFSLRDAVQGLHVWGGIGSGKSTGTGMTWASAYLRSGAGGLILAAKPEEIENWQRLAEENGRAESLVIFDERQAYNFIDAELARHGTDGIGTIVEALLRVLEFSDQATRAAGSASQDESYWADARRQMLTYTLPLLYHVHGKVTVNDVIRFVASAPTDTTLYAEAISHQQPDGTIVQVENPRYKEALRTRFAVQTFHPKCPSLDADMHLKHAIGNYWLQQYPMFHDKLRSSIVSTVTTKLDRFNIGRLRRSFCDMTTVVPEMTFHGALIVMAMPAMTWNEDGIIAQQLFKFCWQRAVDARNALDPVHRHRPVFLWADEAQNFVNLRDAEFLATCRGSRAAVVFLSQTLPTYYGKLGADKSNAIDGLVGTFNTHIFHANACPKTNEFASKLIGRAIQRRANRSTQTGTSRNRGMSEGTNASSGSSMGSSYNSSDMGPSNSSYNSGSTSSSGTNEGRNYGSSTSYNESDGYSEQMDYIVEPSFFSSGALRNGGPRNGNKVDAILFKTSARFAANNDANFMAITYEQKS